MSDKITLTIDGKEIEALRGQTILDAADAAGIYIPRLCAMPGLTPYGSCRVCTVMVNGRPQAACTTPAAEGMVIENDTEDLKIQRSSLVEMLFVEGNHFCMFCEKSGNCRRGSGRAWRTTGGCKSRPHRPPRGLSGPAGLRFPSRRWSA